MIYLDTIDKLIINKFQQTFPLSSRPFQTVAEMVGISEAEVIKRVAKLKADRVISRVGPVFAPHKIGVSTLCAMAIPKKDISRVSSLVSLYDEVNHNYRRNGLKNLWFVLTSNNEKAMQAVIDDITVRTGYEVLDLRMVKSYYVNLGFKIE